ncbi:TadE/TadG family type IV pilus assembly protein [Microbacterium invictum]|uniref:TadE/TadG family type IV pilus assembly protein n=1 Tax=Microbacterium invictum TaxID=515415 RepID=A0ABZ0VJB8_9MICO|nr:TadE/TadG family type IV pilus assembly protein [Microbacterium invictum]WQB71857.1 TadE/TadG family type IV pilus assembly protein [Microbacterium invictum]
MPATARGIRGLIRSLTADAADERGSAPVEFVLVAVMLTALTLGVLQLGLGIYVRNVVHDAAVEGAYHAALADTTLRDGADRTSQIVARTVGAAYAGDVSVAETTALGYPAVEVSVQAPLPVIGLIGLPGLLEVSAHAPVESFD